MEDKGLLSLKDMEGVSVDPTWSETDAFLAVIGVAVQKYEKEEETLKNSEDLENSVDVSRALKKPMTEPVAIPKKHRSVIQAQRNVGGRNYGLKRSYEESFQGDHISFKNQKKSKQKEENLSMRLKKRRPKLDMLTHPIPRTKLPVEFEHRIKAMGGTQVVMVIEKALYETDLKKNNNRLSMPFGKINKGFLRKEEREYLAQQNQIEVKIFIEPSLNELNGMMILRQWDMPKKSGKTSSTYVLKTHWNKVSKNNKLRVKDVIQVWSFRVGNELCLALVVVSRCGGNGSDSSGNEGGKSSRGRDGEEGCGDAASTNLSAHMGSNSSSRGVDPIEIISTTSALT